MTQHSETIGSFLRTGKYPLEADYIFNSFSDLEEWAESNVDILHEGLLKVVTNTNRITIEEDYFTLEYTTTFDGEKITINLTRTVTDDSIEGLVAPELFVNGEYKLFESVGDDTFKITLEANEGDSISANIHNVWALHVLDTPITVEAVLEEDRKQELYWITSNDSVLSFNKLLDNIDRDSIYEQLSTLKDSLEQEVSDREDSDDNFAELINALDETCKDLQDQINILDTRVTQNRSDIKAILGTGEDDIESYLATLDYPTITKISETLHHFLDKVDGVEAQINTLPELQEFLTGYSDSDTLASLLNDLKQSLLGTPNPSPEFETLRNTEVFVRNLQTYMVAAIQELASNVKTELDTTQSGVGLNQDGSYTADSETHFLTGATSVVSALRILDGLVYSVMNSALEGSESETVKLEVTKGSDKTTITANVKLSSSNGNDIERKSDGLYHNIESEYANGVLTIKVNGNIRSQHDLGVSSIVEDAYYNTSEEEIVILFKLLNGDTQKVTIPAGALISEWKVDNSTSKVVEFTKERVTDGPDVLSADVRISSNVDNILEKDNNSLLVRGTSDNIKHNGQSLESYLTSDKQSNSDLFSNVNLQLTSVVESVTAEVTRATTQESNLQTQITTLEGDLNTAKVKSEASDENLQNQINDLKLVDLEIKQTNETQSADITNIKTKLVQTSEDLAEVITLANALEEEKAPINSPIFTGIPQVAISPDDTDASQRIPSTNWVRARIAEIEKDGSIVQLGEFTTEEALYEKLASETVYTGAEGRIFTFAVGNNTGFVLQTVTDDYTVQYLYYKDQVTARKVTSSNVGAWATNTISYENRTIYLNDAFDNTLSVSTIPVANASQDGLMSSDSYVNLGSVTTYAKSNFFLTLESTLLLKPDLINDDFITYFGTTCQYSGDNITNTFYSEVFAIPAATSEKLGLLKASDYTKLSALPTASELETKLENISIDAVLDMGTVSSDISAVLLELRDNENYTDPKIGVIKFTANGTSATVIQSVSANNVCTQYLYQPGKIPQMRIFKRTSPVEVLQAWTSIYNISLSGTNLILSTPCFNAATSEFSTQNINTISLSSLQDTRLDTILDSNNKVKLAYLPDLIQNLIDSNGVVNLSKLPITQITQADYDALETKDDNIIYIITDADSSWYEGD